MLKLRFLSAELNIEANYQKSEKCRF